MKMDIWLFTLENVNCSRTDFLTEFNTGGDYRHALNTEMRLQYSGSDETYFLPCCIEGGGLVILLSQSRATVSVIYLI